MILRTRLLLLLGVALSTLVSAAPDDANNRRADALEAKARADIAAQRWADGLPAATEVVRLRRRAEPADQEALGTALLEYGIFLFALDRQADADAALRDSLQAFLEAPRHGEADDLRLARILEQHAEIVEKGYGRRPWAIELLRQAVVLREQHAASSRGKLAETRVELGLQEMLAADPVSADLDLARAQALLEPMASAQPGNDEDKVLLAQALAMRSGLAARVGRTQEADRLAGRAQAITFTDGFTRVEEKLLVLELLTTQYALAGRLDDAIDAEERRVGMMGDNLAYFDAKRAGRSLDVDIIADGFLSLGKLYIDKGDLAGARSALQNARQRLDDDSELHFAMAQLEQKSGHAELALNEYRAALRLRKESATEVPVLFGTSRAPAKAPRIEAARATSGAASNAAPSIDFGGLPGSKLTLGSASVLVPGGQFSADAWMKPAKLPPITDVGSATDAAKLFVRARRVLETGPFQVEATTELNAARLSPGAVLVFVHGFNVSFDDALRRGAQLARDLNFDGPVAVFSWPSKGSMLAYSDDRVSADAAAARLVEFLDDVALATGTARIHVVAHSMGNRVLLPALARIADDPSSPVRPRLGEIVLAAPAVPKQEFGHWLDLIVARGIGRVTLYASNADKAMWAGWAKEGMTALAGFVSDGVPLLHPGLDSIDITDAVSGHPGDLNHDVFASNPVMTEDIRRLLKAGPRLAPDERLKGVLVRRVTPTGDPYWSYTDRTSTATR